MTPPRRLGRPLGPQCTSHTPNDPQIKPKHDCECTYASTAPRRPLSRPRSPRIHSAGVTSCLFSSRHDPRGSNCTRSEPEATGCPPPAPEGRPSDRRGLRQRRPAPAPDELDPSAAKPLPKAPIRPARSGHLARRCRWVFSGAQLGNFAGRAGGRRAHALAGPWAQANSPCGVGVRRTVTPPRALGLAALATPRELLETPNFLVCI